MEEWMDTSKDGPTTEQPSTSDEAVAPSAEPHDQTMTNVVVTAPESNGDDAQEQARPLAINAGLLARRQANNPGSPEVHSVNSIDMPGRANDVEMGNPLEQQVTRTETPDQGQMTAEQIVSGEGPLTPRNNAGPFVFDGSAGRAGRRVLAIPEITES